MNMRHFECKAFGDGGRKKKILFGMETSRNWDRKHIQDNLLLKKRKKKLNGEGITRRSKLMGKRI